MRKLLARASLLFAAAPLLAIAPVGASSTAYFTDFNSRQPELVYEVYENGVHEAGLACGTDACASFGIQGQRTYGKFTVNHSATPGFYQDIAVSQVAEPGPGNTGPYTVSYGHSVTFEAKVKWSVNYDLYGMSAARGTSGIVLWNGALDANGQTPDYDQIGFTWANQNVLGGYISGLTASSFVDEFPVGVSHPLSSTDIHQWVKVKMIWSQDAQGVQSVAYYIDGQYVDTHVLPSQLHGMSLEIWNDNQEPSFCDTGICNNFPNPDQSQSFYVDYVKITQQ